MHHGYIFSPAFAEYWISEFKKQKYESNTCNANKKQTRFDAYVAYQWFILLVMTSDINTDLWIGKWKKEV